MTTFTTEDRLAVQSMKEPIAFIRQGADGKPMLVPNPLCQFSYESECVKQPDIPLYMKPQTRFSDVNNEQLINEVRNRGYIIKDAKIHVTKPLSDEEILKEWTWKYTTCYEDNLLKFARAIEERILGK